jgi:hypothetical protein
LVDHATVFLQNNLNAALAFNWRGDTTFVNAVRLDPWLDVVTGALFLAGLTTVVLRIAIGRDLRALVVLAVLPVVFLASTLALSFPWENPSVNRAGAAAPIVFAIAGLALARLPTAMAGGGGAAGRFAAGLAVAGLLAVAARENYVRYFHDYDRQVRMTIPNTTEIARAIDGAATVGVDHADAYLIDSPYWLDVRNVGIVLGDDAWAQDHDVRPDDPLPEQQAGRPLFFVLNQGNAERLAELQRVWPNGILTRYAAQVPAQDFLTYWVPPAT